MYDIICTSEHKITQASLFKFWFHTKPKMQNCKPKKCNCMQKMFTCTQISMKLHNFKKYNKQNQNKIERFKKLLTKITIKTLTNTNTNTKD